MDPEFYREARKQAPLGTPAPRSPLPPIAQDILVATCEAPCGMQERMGLSPTRHVVRLERAGKRLGFGNVAAGPSHAPAPWPKWDVGPKNGQNQAEVMAFGACTVFSAHGRGMSWA